MKNKLLSASRFVFVLITAAILLSGLCRTLLLPKDINFYENRKANKLPEFSISGFLSSEFQDKIEAAFSDQIFKAERAKEIYNDFETNFTLGIMKNIYEANPDIYLRFNSLYVFGGDYLVFETRYPDSIRQEIASRAENINAVTKAHPELDFYTYYVEKETDVSFEGGNKTGLYEALEPLIDKSNNRVERFEINDFDTFSKYFFKTDHHWNHRGAYAAYEELVSLLGIEDPLEKGEEYTVGGNMSGSKATQAKAFEIWTEEMYAYKFDFPEMTVTENGVAVEDYGMQNCEMTAPAYGKYYGADSGEIIFDTNNGEKENLLVIGDSFDNALLKLLASGFNKTHSIDLRYYEHYMGQAFDFDEYVKDNGITKVLFIGNIDFYKQSDFNME